MIAAGALLYWINKRKFERTNQYGAEEFNSFGAKLVATSFEKGVRRIAYGLGIIGMLLVAIG